MATYKIEGIPDYEVREGKLYRKQQLTKKGKIIPERLIKKMTIKNKIGKEYYGYLLTINKKRKFYSIKEIHKLCKQIDVNTANQI